VSTRYDDSTAEKQFFLTVCSTLTVVVLVLVVMWCGVGGVGGDVVTMVVVCGD
jgi:hypothetical protein